MRAVALPLPDDFGSWRSAARALLLARVPPDDVIWTVVGHDDLFGMPDPVAEGDGKILVPRPLLDLAKSVICHRDPERFALLYGLLWNTQSDRNLINDHAHPLVHRLDAMAKAVRRDMHKMRAFVRFRDVDEHYVAWFEPEHHIVRANAPFFVSRFGGMRWSILTPELSIHWDGSALTEGPGAVKADAPDGDPVEAIWKAYYSSIFNPARVKIHAMLKEMPKRYWKNMPETALIPALIAGAKGREAAMIERQASGVAARPTLDSLREEAATCQRCSLWRCATRTVFGTGPAAARLMLVGEQPGDQEDLAGQPFVGPAGTVLNQALEDAGIIRDEIYVTNAVKHFKYVQRGKRRIHARPDPSEIDACRWWLDQERAIIQPRIVVALGATAARSLFGKAIAVKSMRGRPHEMPQGGEAWITIHPSYLLRLDDRAVAEREYALFVEDLIQARRRLSLVSG